MGSHDRVDRERLLRRAVIAGDQRAWEAWHGETFAPLYQYVHWRSGGFADLTDDVVQETWLIAVRRIRKFDPRQGSFLAWLRGIAANVLRNRLREHGRRSRGERPHRGDACRESPVEKELIQRERAERIAAALAELPEHCEEVLRAKYLDGASVARIAEASGRTPKAVECLLRRARQMFRTKYQALESAKDIED
ncbi:MAG: RNA polymerase sigma factor [Planctomycetota bacterium]|jgi:RNA polymerase sigma-70 factor (ECF subfamily)